MYITLLWLRSSVIPQTKDLTRVQSTLELYEYTVRRFIALTSLDQYRSVGRGLKLREHRQIKTLDVLRVCLPSDSQAAEAREGPGTGGGGPHDSP